MKENLYDLTSARRVSAFETQISVITKPEGPLHASNLRFIVLGLISIVSFGASFSTSPSMFVSGFREGNYMFANYGIYIVVPLLGGVIVDKWSVRGSLALFGVFIAVGNILLATADQEKIGFFIQLIFGIFLIVVGAGCLIVAQATIAAKWFRNKELALAIGSYLCMSKIGSLLGYAILVDNYQESDYSEDFSDSYSESEGIQQIVLNVGVVLGVLSLVGIIVLIILDIKADQQDAVLGQSQVPQQNNDPEPFGLKNYRLVYYLLICSVFIQGAFLSLDRSLFEELVDTRYETDAISAIQFYTVVGIIFALLFPVFGFLVDRYGKKTFYLSLSSTIFTIMCIIFICVMIGNGFEFRLPNGIYIILDAIFQPIFLCVFWFCIPLIFDQSIMGMGTGLAISTLNLMAAANTALYQFLFNQFNEGEGLGVGLFLIYMVVPALLGTIFSFLLYKEDARTGRKLANPSIMHIEKGRGLNPSIAINSAYL